MNKTNFWLLACSQIFIFIIAYINIFPEGYIVSGADVIQLFNQENLDTFEYAWSQRTIGEGQFSLNYSYKYYYYLISFLSDILNMNPSQQSFLYYSLFFLFSFYSFFWATFVFNKKMHFSNRILISLVYVFNSYTLYLFYFTFGFSPFLTVIYVLIPVLFALFKLFYDSSTLYEASKYMFLLSLVIYILNIPFGNLPFVVSIYLILFLWFLLYIIFFTIYKPFLKTSALIILFFSINSWSLIPQIIALLDAGKRESGIHDIGSWIINQSLPALDMFYMVPWVKHFSQVSFFSFGIFLVIFAIFLYLKNELNNKKQSLVFLILFLFVLFLTNKLIYFFPIEIVKHIFGNLPLAVIRSYDKTLVFIPFLILIIIVINTNKKIFIYSILCLSLLTAFPFFTGKLQKDISVAHTNKNVNYKNSEYSFLVKIPSDYLKVSNIANKKSDQYKIMSLPYNVINSVGWSNYPQWKYVGADPTHQLFQRAIIDVNNVGGMFSSDKSSYGKMFNDESSNYLWILNFMKVLNIGEILYHKDVRFDFNQMSYFKIKDLE